MENMNNNVQHQVTFKAAKQHLKDADWICRSVRKSFPAILPNKLFLENDDLISNNSNIDKFIRQKMDVLRQDRADRRFLQSPFKVLNEIIYSASQHHVAQCYECSALAEMVARMNGIDNCYKLTMKDYDHTFLLLTQKPLSEGFDVKNSIIVDAWLGISGRIKDIFLKYQNVYNDFFHISSGDIVVKTKKPLELTGEEIKLLREKYPELVFKSASGRKLMENI